MKTKQKYSRKIIEKKRQENLQKINQQIKEINNKNTINRNKSHKKYTSIKKIQQCYKNQHQYQKFTTKKYSIEMAIPCLQLTIGSSISKKLVNNVNGIYNQFHIFTICDFQIKSLLGSGSTSIVWEAYHSKSNKLYALKQISKIQAITNMYYQYVINERKMLESIPNNSKFLVGMFCAFQTQINLYLGFSYLPGKDLRFHMNYIKNFEEADIRFFIGCIINSLQCLRSYQIIHRDIKPQNLIFNQNGYLYLTDFGTAIKSNIKDINVVGTSGYISPQVLSNSRCGYQADYFSVGVILYQCLMGKKPYRQKQGIKMQLLKIGKNQIPNNCSIEAAHFINRLLQKDPTQRLGHQGIKQIKEHLWLKQFPWQQLQIQKLQSSYKPMLLTQKIIDNFNNNQQYPNTEINNVQLPILDNNFQDLFLNYTWYNISKFMDSTSPSSQFQKYS